MSDDPTPKRRWFRFSLRTLFIVLTVFACWLGYQVNWVRQRHEVIGDPQVQNWRFFLVATTYRNPPQEYRRRIYSTAPWPLNWLGEPGYWAIGLPKVTSDQEAARVRRLFPEAEGVVVDERDERTPYP